MAEGTQEKVWACRRSKESSLGRVRGGGADHHRNLPTQVCTGSHRAGRLWHRLLLARSHLLRLQETTLLVQAAGGQALLLWAGGSMGLSATWCLLCDLQAAGTDCRGLLRGQREAWPATPGGL